MKKLVLPAAFVLAIAASAFTIAENSHWNIVESEYEVKMVSDKFEGVFKGLKADIHFNENDLSTAKISASIDAASINTGNGMRNKHAQQGLESDKYPSIKFVSSSVSKTGSGFDAQGALTIKDVTKNIHLPFTFTRKGEGGIFSGGFSIVPQEYHVDKKGTPEKIEIKLTVPVKK